MSLYIFHTFKFTAEEYYPAEFAYKGDTVDVYKNCVIIESNDPRFRENTRVEQISVVTQVEIEIETKNGDSLGTVIY